MAIRAGELSLEAAESTGTFSTSVVPVKLNLTPESVRPNQSAPADSIYFALVCKIFGTDSLEIKPNNTILIVKNPFKGVHRCSLTELPSPVYSEVLTNINKFLYLCNLVGNIDHVISSGVHMAFVLNTFMYLAPFCCAYILYHYNYSIQKPFRK